MIRLLVALLAFSALTLACCAGQESRSGQAAQTAPPQRTWTAQIEKTDPPVYHHRNDGRAAADLEEVASDDANGDAQTYESLDGEGQNATEE